MIVCTVFQAKESGPVGDVSNRYEHSRLTDFIETSGPKEIPDGISEGKLFRLFMTNKINLFVTKMNRYAGQLKEERGETELHSVNKTESACLRFFLFCFF